MAICFVKRPPLPPPSKSPEAERQLFCPVVKDLPVIDEKWASGSWTVRQAMSTKPFLHLTLTLFSGTFATQAILTHQVAFFIDQGLDNLFASYIVGMIGLVSIGTKIFWGVLSDKIGREITYTLGILCGVFGMVLLVLFQFLSSSSWLSYSYAFLFGAGYAVTTTLPPIIAADFFEGRSFGSVFGAMMIFNGIGGALGTWLAGFVYDHTNTYLFVFLLMIGCYLFACLNVWWAAPRRGRIAPGKPKR